MGLILVLLTLSGGLGAEPVEFKPGVTGGRLFRGCFAAGGTEFYFFQKIRDDAEEYRIYVSRKTGAVWNAAEPVDLGGPHSDMYPAVSADGQRLVFSSYRRMPGDAGPKPNAGLWIAERRGSRGWGPPSPLPILTEPGHYHSWVEFGRDGSLHFRRTTPDWRGNKAMVSRWNGREFERAEEWTPVAEVQRLAPELRIVGGSPGPQDGVVLLDVATRNPVTGLGASDIYFSTRVDGKWARPRPAAGGVNSDGYDVFPFFSPDSARMYFVRDFSAFFEIAAREALR
jgi:hypothetical protein